MQVAPSQLGSGLGEGIDLVDVVDGPFMIRLVDVTV